MKSHSTGLCDAIRSAKSLPWGDEIWHEDERWFTLAQLLWVKLYNSSMSYGQLSYVVTAPLLPSRSRPWSASATSNPQPRRMRSQVYEMELIMDPERGILLIGEVYGKPGDRVWRPEQIYGRLFELGIVLQEFLQRELAGTQSLFSPGYALILRDTERSCTEIHEKLGQLNIITRDELSTIHHRINAIMEKHSHGLEVPFHSYGHMVIEIIRNIEENSLGELGGFRSPEDIYQVPRLPAWLR